MDRGPIRDTFIVDVLAWHPPVSISRALIYTVVVFAAAVAIAPHRFVIDGTDLTDGHAVESMDIAINRAWCNQPSSVSTKTRFPHWIRDHIDQRSIPLRTIIAREAGSLEAYCSTVTQPIVNNENSLMVVESWVLSAWPSISVSELGVVLHVIRIACVGLFTLLLLCLGASLMFALAIVLSGLILLGTMERYVYSVYPFLFALVLLAVTLYGFALRYQWSRGPIGRLTVAVGAGFLSALIGNMRTSYVPIAIALFLVFAIDHLLTSSASMRWPRRLRLTAALLAGFGVGYVAMQYSFITRFLPADRLYSARHSVGHPLVLSLGVPENDFSRELGIHWLDAVGGERALAVDSDAAYLGPKYDGVLINYYTGLWKAYPRRIAGVYLTKFSVAGTGVLQSLRWQSSKSGRAMRALLIPYSYIPSGWWLLPLYGLIAIASSVIHYRRRAPGAFVLGLLSFAACLAHIESGIIYSIFIESYHNYIAFYVLFLSLVGFQVAVNASLFVTGVAQSRMTRVGRALGTSVSRVSLASLGVTSVPGAVRAAAVTMLTVLLWLAAVPEWFTIERASSADPVAFAALDRATSLAWCGPGFVPSVTIGEDAIGNDAHRPIPIRAIVNDKAGSLDAYCQRTDHLAQPLHPLVWLQGQLLRVRPQMSAAGLSRALHFIRLAGLAAFVFAVILAGGGWLSAAAAFGAGTWLLVGMQSRLFSPEPFAPVLFLNLAAACALAIRYRRSSRANVTTAASGAAIGFCAALVWFLASGSAAGMVMFLFVVLAFDQLLSDGVISGRGSLALLAGIMAGVLMFAAVGLPDWDAGAASGHVAAADSDRWNLGWLVVYGAAVSLWGATAAVRRRSSMAGLAAIAAVGSCFLYAPVMGSAPSWGEQQPLGGILTIVTLVAAQAAVRNYASPGARPV